MAKRSLNNVAAPSGSGSITRHSAFPAIVALWFTALLGLGGLLIPTALLERLLESSGIATWVPAATPPLGLTSQVMVAVVLGAAGAALGFRIARRVAGAGTPDETARRSRADRRAMFNVATDIVAGEEPGERASTTHPLRRRALAVADLGSAAERIGPDAEPRYDHAPAHDEASDHRVETPGVEDSLPEPGFHEWRRDDEVFEEPLEVANATAEALEITHVVETVEPFDEPEKVDASEWPEPEPEREPEPEPEFRPEAAAVVEAELESQPELTHASAPKPVVRTTPSSSLDELDITQLVERFADTVRRRSEWLTSARRPSHSRPTALEIEPPAPRLAPVTPPPAEEEPAVQPPPFFDWLHHLNVEAQDDAPAPGFSVPMHTAAFVHPSHLSVEEEPELEADAEAEADDVYGSLIEMKNPFAPPRSDFIRIDDGEAEPGAEIEPTHELEAVLERRDTADAEESLRAALAKLQQLSGHH
ncbi:hypothetical protein KK137_14035 [Croceibacterium sp. LX-88]|uniref:Uncharacterized protein n=1 Tax=Croceibacterium selenioxidans TaxID=2838833 RepID=A0ABS5W6T9_9SPHN|nr:hypothetical protein [Croceibacterium selenioxidans]MBT2135453.1 hypothetical protein [Croceibacterium selenioxidans]